MVLIDNTGLDTEAKCLAQLGNFAKFPTEIRLMIWESLFGSYADKYRLPESGTDALSILCSSRYLYHEIVPLVYENMTHGVHIHNPCHGETWVTAEISSKRLDTMRFLKNDDAIRTHIHNFPFGHLSESRLQVSISHPYGGDPGQIIKLWQSINRFVDILKTSPRIPYVSIQLVGKWHDERSPKQSIRDLRSNHRYRYDHDIALLPFTILPKWDCQMTPELWAMILERKHSLSCQLFHQLCEAHPGDIDRLCMLDDKWKPSGYECGIKIRLIDTRIFLDTALDTLKGRTARLLRLERFKNWFEDGDTWKSAYEEQFMSDLIHHRDIVLKYDPKLNKARWRHTSLMLTHHTVHAPKDDPEQINAFCINPNRKLYRTWDLSIWSEAMPYGVDIPQADMAPCFSHSHIYQVYEAWTAMKTSAHYTAGLRAVRRRV
jgi:hypothetical protein